MRRRAFLRLACALPCVLPPSARAREPAVVRGHALRFPRDHGSHPEFRIEWWYATGLLDAAGETLGFQITFFRVRNANATASPSRFAPRQVLFAHAALSVPREGRLLHAERAARAGWSDAYAREADASVRIGPWKFARDAQGGGFRASLPKSAPSQPFAYDLTLSPTQPVLLQGDDGYSQKGPSPEQASYYYSLPHLAVAGVVTRGGATRTVTGRAWFDHEWSEAMLDERASGWDWIGMNLDDGGALMAIRIRRRGNDDALWAAATLRTADGHVRSFTPQEVTFRPRRHWTSPRTQTRYPVAFEIRIGNLAYDVDPLFDAQELDSRGSTGVVYWEGAASLSRGGRVEGRGYLELTGYNRPLTL